MSSGCGNLERTICKPAVVFHERRKNHVTIVIEGKGEEYKEIARTLSKALARCPGKPSYAITGVDFLR